MEQKCCRPCKKTSKTKCMLREGLCCNQKCCLSGSEVSNRCKNWNNWDTLTEAPKTNKQFNEGFPGYSEYYDAYD